MTWGEDLAAWWVAEIESDPAYREVVLPMVADLVGSPQGERWLDLGCGEGRVMRMLAGSGARPVGCDSSAILLGRAGGAGPVVLARLPHLGWLASRTVDGAIAVLVLEHLADVEPFFADTARVVRPDGALVLVANHPVFTSPGSAPVVDVADGELLWRWGPYLRPGASEEPAGGRTLTFHHRPLGALLTAAAEAGWSLVRVVEVGTDPGEAGGPAPGQEQIPRLIGVRWRRG